jgi:hypothetical protein
MLIILLVAELNVKIAVWTKGHSPAGEATELMLILCWTLLIV